MISSAECSLSQWDNCLTQGWWHSRESPGVHVGPDGSKAVRLVSSSPAASYLRLLCYSSIGSADGNCTSILNDSPASPHPGVVEGPNGLDDSAEVLKNIEVTSDGSLLEAGRRRHVCLPYADRAFQYRSLLVLLCSICQQLRDLPLQVSSAATKSCSMCGGKVFTSPISCCFAVLFFLPSTEFRTCDCIYGGEQNSDKKSGESGPPSSSQLREALCRTAWAVQKGTVVHPGEQCYYQFLPSKSTEGGQHQEELASSVNGNLCTAILRGTTDEALDESSFSTAGGATAAESEIPDIRWTCEPSIQNHPCIRRIKQELVVAQYLESLHNLLAIHAIALRQRLLLYASYSST